jgi:hypothetical protein
LTIIAGNRLPAIAVAAFLFAANEGSPLFCQRVNSSLFFGCTWSLFHSATRAAAH